MGTTSPAAVTTADRHLHDLLVALAQPAAYQHHPEHIQVVQTHISAVFLAGDEVYKLKKPITLSFLDYSTLALRRHFCEEEVRLNQRLAPSVYLGVVPVLRAASTYRVREALNMHDATVVDYLVRMRRLPPERTLDSLLRTDQVTKFGVHTLAKRLVHFHQTAATTDAHLYGSPEVIWQALADNFAVTEPFVGQTIPHAHYATIVDFSKQFFDSHQALFVQRVRRGRVREGHGDLRCDHVYFLDEGLVIIDCVEFSPRLRTCDVASELAFLAMDLEMRGAPNWAGELLHAYATQAEDEELFSLLPFYQCYRAYVRGKVESLKSNESEIPDDERDQARRQARRAFRLAYRYARGTPRPAIIAVCGQIATGKSTIAHLISEQTGFSVQNSDVVRKRLAGLLPTTHATAEYKKGLYGPEFTRRTYEALRTVADEEVRSGRGIILDATYKNPADRAALVTLADELAVPLFFVECRASVATIEQRLREREQQGDSASDATRAIAEQERATFPALSDIPEEYHVIVDTEGDIDHGLAQLDERLLQAG